MNVYIFEDRAWKNLLPLTWLRPVFGLRCGIMTLAEKIALRYGKVNTVAREYLSPIIGEGILTAAKFPLTVPANTLFINGGVLHGEVSYKDTPKVWRTSLGVKAAFCFDQPKTWRSFTDFEKFLDESDNFKSLPEIPSDGAPIQNLWDIFTYNAAQIESDYNVMCGPKGAIKGGIYEGAHLIGKKNHLFLGPGSEVEPGVILDMRKGPIYIGPKCMIRSGTAIEGPCAIHVGSFLHEALIHANTTFGPKCRIGGEVCESVFQGYTNKSHAGFIGHSVVGEWVNFGAMTTGSNLKNTYGPVKVQVNGRLACTGLEKVGAFIGDHAKFGIGSLLTTGSVIGLGANLVANGKAFPKFVPSLAWENPESRQKMDFDKLVEVATRVMKRRDVSLTDGYLQTLKVAVKMALETERAIGKNPRLRK